VNKAVLDLSKLFQGSIQDEFTDIMQSSLDSMGINDSKEWCQTRSKLDNKLKVDIGRAILEGQYFMTINFLDFA
jgi:hypothetical protein